MSEGHIECVESVAGLVLSGGGARAAYQVGVLAEIAKIRGERRPGLFGAPSPFQVVCGTSAGAINGAALATRSDNFDSAMQEIEGLWADMKAGDVYHADGWGVARSGAKWISLFSVGWALAKWRRLRPKSLLDNEPLWSFLDKAIKWDRLPSLIQTGALRAVAVACSSYSDGEHATFYQGSSDLAPWLRSSRRSEPAELSNKHLMASAAIPFVFPAVDLGFGWFGDGSMRQTAPISPAIHLGATKILVVGAGRMAEPQSEKFVDSRYPSLGQIAGHALSNIFLDALSSDVERMQRINKTLEQLTPQQRETNPLKPVELLLIAPSKRLDGIAADMVGELPKPVRAMLAAFGVSKAAGRGGGALASYLLFEAAYTKTLMELGKKDARSQESKIIDFFGWNSPRKT
jgi:NTE family protein